MVNAKNLIGASLSEPHTSVTALRTRVSIRLTIYGPTTYRKFKSTNNSKNSSPCQGCIKWEKRYHL